MCQGSPAMKTPTTTKQVESDPRVDEVQRQTRCDDYNVIIWLADGYVAEDGTSTLYGRTVREAARNLATVREGTPE